jgi:hypothetical protein
VRVRRHPGIYSAHIQRSVRNRQRSRRIAAPFIYSSLALKLYRIACFGLARGLVQSYYISSANGRTIVQIVLDNRCYPIASDWLRNERRNMAHAISCLQSSAYLAQQVPTDRLSISLASYGTPCLLCCSWELYMCMARCICMCDSDRTRRFISDRIARNQSLLIIPRRLC